MFAGLMEKKALVHRTAIIDPRAKIAADVAVGPYSVIRGEVTIGAGSIVHEHTVIGGNTIIGRNCKIGPAAYVGMDPQHLRFTADEKSPTYLIIGDNVTVRESARLHRATQPGLGGATRIGDNCFLMGAVHVAHDCVVEPDVIMADAALLGGHCHIGRGAFLGGGCTIHQFVHIGRLAIVSGNEPVSHDVPPFAAFRYGRLKGYNAIGCGRAGLGRETVKALRECFLSLRRHRTTSAALASVRSEVRQLPEVREWIEFIEASHRGIPTSRQRQTELQNDGAEQ
jgi:UDP-N-acetylglucosamine acyltransferase